MLSGDLAPVAGMVRTALADARFWAASILLPFAHFGDAFIDKGREIAARNEQTRISFQVLMGDVKKANDLLEKLIDYAAHTPFELPQLFNVTQGLVAFGDTSEQVMEHLKMMGDVSGGVHEKFQILGIVFNQIRAEERLLIQDFKQLSIRGMLFITDLAKYLGVSVQEAKKMQRAGKISFEDVRGTLMMLTTAGHRFHNMMELQSKSIIGLTATLKDNWDIFASKIAESLIPLDRVILKIKINLVDAMSDLTTATKGFAAGAFVGAVAASKLALALTAAAVAAKFLNIRLKTMFFGFSIAGAIIGIGAALGGLVGWFMRTTEGLEATEQGSKNLGKIWKNLKAAGNELYISLSEGLFNAFGVTLPDILNESAEFIADWVVTVSEWFVTLSEMALFAANAIGFVWRNAFDLLAIGGLDFFLSFVDGFQVIAEVAQNAANVIAKVFRGTMAFLTAIFDNFIAITRHKIAQLTQWLKEQWALHSGVVEGLMQGMSWEDAAKHAAEKLKKIKAEDLLPENPILADPEQAFIDEYNKAGGFDVLGDFDKWKKMLQEERDILQKRVEERENARRTDTFPPKEPPTKPGDRPRRSGDGDLIDPGRYGFIEFGNKIQDAFLKGKGDKQQQMVDLLAIGNNLQQKLLDQQNRNGGLAP